MTPHILFVDDDAPIREMLSLYFRKRGFTVTAATRGEEAMELIDQVAFDLAILDVNLAGENGLELLGFMKSNLPDLPVIMFTGHESDPELFNKSLSRGASGFMRKSEPLDSLFAEVRKHLPAAAQP